MRAGTLHGQSPGRQMISLIGRITCRYCCPAFVRPKSDSGTKVNAIPGSAKKCSASARNPVHLHPGNPFTLSPESRSPCPGIRSPVFRSDDATLNPALKPVTNLHPILDTGQGNGGSLIGAK